MEAVIVLIFFLFTTHVCLVDVDECQSVQHRCGEGQLCHNMPGSYRCECLTGYQYDSFRRMCIGVYGIACSIRRNIDVQSVTDNKLEIYIFYLQSCVSVSCLFWSLPLSSHP